LILYPKCGNGRCRACRPLRRARLQRSGHPAFAPARPRKRACSHPECAGAGFTEGSGASGHRMIQNLTGRTALPGFSARLRGERRSSKAARMTCVPAGGWFRAPRSSLLTAPVFAIPRPGKMPCSTIPPGTDAADGLQAPLNNTIAGNNTGVGVNSLLPNTTGSNNVGIGFSSGNNLATELDLIHPRWRNLKSRTAPAPLDS
jgi:hypothetical protein